MPIRLDTVLRKVEQMPNKVNSNLLNLIDYPLGEHENMDPYTMFVYGIRSTYTKESYFRRLRIFFNTSEF
jgi:hypothetical protein